MEQEWFEINGYNGEYFINKNGEIRSVKTTKKGKVIDRILKQGLSTRGYRLICLSINSVSRTEYTHKLMAYTFLGHKPSGYYTVINHIDGNQINNNLNNLEITTQRENVTNKARRKNTNHLIGAYPYKKSKAWKAMIMNKGKAEYLGSFKTELLANAAYQSRLTEILSNS